MPPPVQIGERDEPARARPGPFWRHGLAPPPRAVAPGCGPAAAGVAARFGRRGALPAGVELRAHGLVDERAVEARAEGDVVELDLLRLRRAEDRGVSHRY